MLLFKRKTPVSPFTQFLLDTYKGASKGDEREIIDAIHAPVGATTVDGIKFRCRPGMGRCQGGFCRPRVIEILARELGIRYEEITKRGEDTNILIGKTKDIALRDISGGVDEE